MNIIATRSEAQLLADKQLELIYRRYPFSFWSALLLSGGLAIALWPLVERTVLLAWLLSLWLVMTVRMVYARHYLKLGPAVLIDHKRWRFGMLAGAALAGTCWGFSVWIIPALPIEPASLLLLFGLAGVTAFASISLAAVPLAAQAFLLPALLPVAFWLFSFGEQLTSLMGAITLGYLGLTLLFSRQTCHTIHGLLATTEQNRELAAVQQANEQRMRRYFESAPGCFFTLVRWTDGRYAMPFASAGIRDLFGLEPEDVEQDVTPLAAIGHPDDVEMMRRKIEESACSLTPYQVEYRIVHPQKGMRWIEVNALPQSNPGGGVRWDGFLHDITERKEIEQHLKLHEFALDQAHEGVYLADENLRFVYVNEEACRALGYSRDELMGLAVTDIDSDFKPEEILTVSEKMRLEGSSTFTFETRHRRRDGSTFPVEVQLSAFGFNGQQLGMSLARDITERKRMEEALAAREQEFRSLAESSPDKIVRYDRNGCHRYLNSALVKMLGLSGMEEALGKRPREMWTDGRYDKLEQAVAQVVESGAVITDELREPDGAGGEYVHLVSVVPERDTAGRIVGSIIFGRDITERKRMEEALAVREQEARTVVENSPDSIARYDRDCRRVYVNHAFSAMVDGGAAALLGKTPSECPGGGNYLLYEAKINEVFASGEDAEFELRWTDKENGELCSHIRLTAERDTAGNIVSVLGVGRDITELNEHRKQVYQMAFYDPLTSLPNRALFTDRLHQMLAEASRHGQQAGVMLLDLDRFKTVNDTLGHPAGDQLLRNAADRLSACLRACDTVARLGGDEFAVLLPEVRSCDDLGRVAGKILASFNEPALLEGKELFISCSIGIAVYPSDSRDADDLLRQADSAMYFAKRSGRDTFRFYSKDLMDSANERLALEADLRRGFGRGELMLHFQPKVNLADGAVIGSEALLRWNSPERGWVPPNKFIPIAEDSGLIVDIGAWVLRDACRTASEWNGPGKALHKVAINLSARQFQSNNLLATVCDTLEQTGCRPEWIELEMTESLLMDEHGTVLDVLEAFRDRGITIAIDDFGTGYSSLSYLARFPIDTLKIDRSFISRVTESGHHAELVKAIISIAYSLKQTVVAEGVETAEQAALLRAYGCHIAQGYLYSRPIPKPEFELLPLAYGQEALLG